MSESDLYECDVAEKPAAREHTFIKVDENSEPLYSKSVASDGTVDTTNFLELTDAELPSIFSYEGDLSEKPAATCLIYI